jgi:hypothetical protein
MLFDNGIGMRGPFLVFGARGANHFTLQARSVGASLGAKSLVPLRRPFEGDEREVPVATEPLDVEFELSAGLSAQPGVRRGADRVAQPVWARLEARPPAGCRDSPVSFLGCAPGKELVRSEAVVPVLVESAGFLEATAVEWNDHAAKELVLHAKDEPLDDGDAALLADGPEARLDPAPPAPAICRDLEIWGQRSGDTILIS